MDQLLNEDTNNPLYLQLREIIRGKIESGEFIPGASIPSENEFAQKYGLNRLTVRSAIRALVNEGLLQPIQGKGVFVVSKRMDRDLDKLTGFRQTMRERNVEPSTKVLVKAVRSAGVKYAHILQIEPDDQIYYIKRLNYANEEPVSIEHIYIPCVLLKDLDKVDLNVFSLYDIYEFNDIRLTTAWQTLSLTTLDAKDARTLKIKPGTAVLLFECVSKDEQGKVIEFSRAYTRGDTARYSVNFSRVDPGIPRS
ncbi:MAG TPA: GntR family transcriptional regulator [Anaerolineaceae bacterium]|nr:GntR family transcriptional regulator [Anaerolineaceae bacterium]